ncbi:MAG TPA: Xaa-Pro peptidase family protein [Vicinamibacterales bacterium]|nr:Xaa-Pro peptidase family protein [Vicinamibacterales bacterium]
MSLPPATVSTRLTHVRDHVRAAELDALVVTHLPNLRYLTGFSGSAGAAVLMPRRCLLLVDFRYVTAANDLAGALDGLVTVETFDRSYDEAIVDVLRRERSVRIGVEAAYLPVSRFNAISSALAARSPLPVESLTAAPALVATERIVERARLIKDAAEVETLREAGRRLGRLALDVPRLVREGRTELDIAAEIETALRLAGFSRPAFETIVASGPNSALPHARPTDRPIRAGEPTVLDFGGVYDGYCVDLTRTVQLGAVSGRQAALFAAVREAQDAAIRTVRPGVAASTIDAAARSVLERHGLGEAFGHGTGHGLGLEVHEEPRIARQSPRLPDQVIEPGMVFTIEPGAYVPGIGGVRIEDDVLVTADGCEVLTRPN